MKDQYLPGDFPLRCPCGIELPPALCLPQRHACSCGRVFLTYVYHGLLGGSVLAWEIAEQVGEIEA